MNENLSDRVVIEAWQEAVREEVRTRPWLAALLLQKGSRLFERFVWFYGRVTAVGQHTRRRLAVGIGTAALALALSSAPTPAHAATITVDPGAIGIQSGDGCSLVEAIINANNGNQTHPDCDPGSNGPDIIVLPANSIHSYTTAHGTDSALPNITTPITIEANGATIQRTSGTMRILRVNAGGNLTLNNATITGGSGVTNGGGILNNNSTLTLNNSTVSGNVVSYRGGGIYNMNGIVTVNNSVVSGNMAGSYGGGIFNFSANGICTAPARLIVRNSTVSDNTTLSILGGGGIFNGNGVAEIIHSTITGNTAPANTGAGVQSWNDGSTCTRVGGSIIAGNLTGGDVAAYTTTQRFHSLGYNLIGTNGNNVNFTLEFNATGDINGNTTPELGPLANNGGPTLTHALLAGSPAIDLVPTGVLNCTAGVSTDQRGAVRAGEIIPDDGRGGLACDAGAFEFASNQTPMAVTNLFTQTSSPNPASTIPLIATLLTLLSGAWLWLSRRIN